MISKSLKVIRSAVGSPSAAGMIKELRSRGVSVVGIDSDPDSAGFFLCDKHYLVPMAVDPGFIDFLLDVCDKEKPSAIISGPEEELLAIAKQKNIFEKKGVIVLAPDYENVKICADKNKTYEFFIKENIPTPRMLAGDSFKFPAIVKPAFGRGSKDVFVVNNQEELAIAEARVKNPIVQEFISGKEFTIDIFADLSGNPLSVVPRERLKVESGIAMQARTVFDQEMIDYCRRIVIALKLVGPSCIQCIRGDEGIKFIEINPRFGGGSILSIKADPSIMNNLLAILEGKPTIASKGFKENIIMMRYYAETYVNL